MFQKQIYEGRSMINKLQKGIILLISKIWKIRNGRFVYLIPTKSCKFYCDDVTVTSFVNYEYGDITIESIP